MHFQSPDVFVPYDIRLYVSSSYPTPHFHDRAELLIVLSGEVTLTVSRRIETIRAGECALVLPMRVHSFESVPGIQHLQWLCPGIRRLRHGALQNA